MIKKGAKIYLPIITKIFAVSSLAQDLRKVASEGTRRTWLFFISESGCCICICVFEGNILSFVELVEHFSFLTCWPKATLTEAGVRYSAPIFLSCKLTAWWERFHFQVGGQYSVQGDPGAFWALQGWLLPAVLSHIPSTLRITPVHYHLFHLSYNIYCLCRMQCDGWWVKQN